MTTEDCWYFPFSEEFILPFLKGRYFKNMHMCFHEPKASVNTSMRVNFHPPYCMTTVINCALYIG